jgi:hypothetical protein
MHTQLYREAGSLADDPRFVIMSVEAANYVEDWQHGVLTGRDYWACADAFIAQRIAGTIPRERRLSDAPPVDDSLPSVRTQPFSKEDSARNKSAKSIHGT